MSKTKDTRKWTEYEFEILEDMFMNGKTVKEIAEVLGRSRGSVSRKLYDKFGTSNFVEFISSDKKPERTCQMSDSEMVALLREHGWTVTCTKTQTIEL